MNTTAIDRRLASIIDIAKQNGFRGSGKETLAPGCVIEGVAHNSPSGRSIEATCTLTSSKGQVKRVIHFGPIASPIIEWDTAKVREWENTIIEDLFLHSLSVEVQAYYSQTFAAIATVRANGADDCARKIINDLALPDSLSSHAQAFPVIKKALQFYLAANS